MWFLDNIIYWLAFARDQFYDAYLEVKGWIFPFYYLSTPLYYIWWVFKEITKLFSNFNDWVDDTAQKLTTFFTELDLTAWFKPWISKILDAWNWVRDAWSNITRAIGDWWAVTSSTVQGWISIAVEGLAPLLEAWSNFWNITFPQWTRKLDSLKTAWDNFWTGTLPTLVSFQWLSTWWDSKLTEIDALITTKLQEWFPFYDTLAELWDSITEFITDPLGWLHDRLELFFDRFW